MTKKKSDSYGMRIGNVIESPGGGLWIVTGTSTTGVEAVSFEHENSSATMRWKNTSHQESCDCDVFDSPCKKCGGSGYRTVKVWGWKHAKVLAPTVNDFIMQAIRRQFRL